MTRVLNSVSILGHRHAWFSEGGYPQEGSPMLVGAEAHRPGRAKILGDRDVLFWAPRPLRVRQRHLFGL
jgi:hypothetical protein